MCVRVSLCVYVQMYIYIYIYKDKVACSVAGSVGYWLVRLGRIIIDFLGPH